MDTLVNQVEKLAATADTGARQKILLTLRDLAYSIEEPEDTINRIGYLVSAVCISVDPCPEKRFWILVITWCVEASANGSC